MVRKLKKSMLQSPIVLAAPMQTRLEKRPFTQTILTPPGVTFDKVQKASFGCLVIPAVVAFVASLVSANWALLLITTVFLLLVGVAVWVVKLRGQMVWRVTWHEDQVEVEDGRYGATEWWTEPLTAFTGLQREVGHIRRGGQYTPNQPVYGLLLAHPDPFKSILLHASREPIGAEAIAYYEAQLSKKLHK